MSAFVLKIIAMISMTFDHSSYIIFGDFSFFNLLGRIAFPIFAYQITEGYTYTHNLKKYFLRLCIFALISQIPFALFESIFTDSISLNVFFTLLFGLLAITIYDNLSKIECKNKYVHIFYIFIGILFATLLSAFAEILNTDYGWFGVLVIFSFFLFRKYNFFMNLSFLFLVLIYYGRYLLIPSLTYKYMEVIIFTLIPLLFINLYNHKKGRDTKYFLYIFYPLHLLILYVIHLIV